jgi:hypothetical protein
VRLLGSHFPQWGRELWEPIRGAVQQQGLPVHSFVVEHESGFVNQAWELVLQQPADLVHLSKPRLPEVVFGVLYKRLCHGLPEPRERMRPLWTRLAVDLDQRFDGITVANRPLQQALATGRA